MNMSVQKKIKSAMKNAGFNQKRLAELTGISKSGISQYCSGTITPGAEAVEKLAAALGVSTKWLLDGEEKEEISKPETTDGKMSVEMAARLMNVGTQFIREGLKCGSLPFGAAVLFPSGRYQYYISCKRFKEFTGIQI